MNGFGEKKEAMEPCLSPPWNDFFQSPVWFPFSSEQFSVRVFYFFSPLWWSVGEPGDNPIPSTAVLTLSKGRQGVFKGRM